MPKKSDSPIPKKRFHGGRWRIYWKWNSTQYTLPTPYTDAKKVAMVNSDLRVISAALVMPEPEFPEGYATLPPVLAYLEARRKESSGNAAPPEEWLAGYIHEITGRNTPGWIRDSEAMLKRLEKFADGFEKLDEKAAAEYMATIAAKRTPGTHMAAVTEVQACRNRGAAARTAGRGSRNRDMAAARAVRVCRSRDTAVTSAARAFPSRCLAAVTTVQAACRRLNGSGRPRLTAMTQAKWDCPIRTDKEKALRSSGGLF